MSVDWATIRPRIVEVFTELAFDQVMEPADPPTHTNPYFDDNAPEVKVVWKERRDDAFTAPTQEAQVSLKVTAVVGHGEDEWRYIMQDVPGSSPVRQDLFESIVGLRRITLQVRAEVQEETDSRWAFQTIERIRTRLGWTRIINKMIDVNVDITDYLDAVDKTYTADGRRVSCAILTVILTAAINDTDPVPTGFIAQILLSTHVKEGNADVSSPPNVTDSPIPPTI